MFVCRALTIVAPNVSKSLGQTANGGTLTKVLKRCLLGCHVAGGAERSPKRLAVPLVPCYTGDYDIEASIDPDRAQADLDEATRFVDRSERYLDERGLL
jgi:hypothetical protein